MGVETLPSSADSTTDTAAGPVDSVKGPAADRIVEQGTVTADSLAKRSEETPNADRKVETSGGGWEPNKSSIKGTDELSRPTEGADKQSERTTEVSSRLFG